MTPRTLWLKRTAFGLAGLLVCLLMAATLLEKTHGSAFASEYIYRSPLVIGLWGATALISFLYIIRRKLQRQYATLALHLSFLFILGGALITHLTGIQGHVHLRQGEAPVNRFATPEGDRQFPFGLSLREFRLSYYPGTFTPMDFASYITITQAHEAGTLECVVSMNRILRYRHYRFYQSSYDGDGQGTTLSVSYDPYGIAVTYAGYALLLLSILSFFFQRDSQFRQLLRHPLLRKGASGGLGVLLLFLLWPAPSTAAKRKMPQALPAETAARFGDLYIYYNDRICPLQTVARDFTTKLYGKESYRGLSAEQVLTGWFFFYDDWKEEPMIRVKDKYLQKILNADGPYARLTDFIGRDGYKLEGLLQKEGISAEKKKAEEANEKFNLVSMLCTGNLLRIYPCRPEGKATVWYSPADKLPADTPEEQWIFIRSSLNYVAEMVNRKEYAQTEEVLGKIKKYQRKEAGDELPSDRRFQAEKVYNRLGCNRPLAMLCVAVGLLSFVISLRRFLASGRHSRLPDYIGCGLMGLLCLYLTAMLVLRGYVSGHAPLANGFETMMFMAWCSSVLTLACRSRFGMALPFGFLVCGLALMVAMLGESNPQITLLMPVLSSPLLSLHVVVIMIAYSLLAFTMLNGATALILLCRSSEERRGRMEYLAVVSRILLYPAVFLLAAGIFIGAVWANVSWGRYWGWDPKEVWALITLLVYASALHTASLPRFRHPVFFHTFCIAAFLTVLITYFGVNFLLGGMHSYAAG